MLTRASFLLTLPALVQPAASATCCWSKWGDASSCGGYSGSGGKCNTDWHKTCQSSNDCPDAPAPTPPSPTPPSPPSPTPPAPSGSIRGFWFGYAGSDSPKPAPASGWFFSFPGQIVNPPFTPTGNIPAPPTWGTYEKRILTQGGGGTSWGSAVYSQMKSHIGEYKSAGWDGVCWDWEKTSSDHTSASFNELMKAAKGAGLINIVTSTAEGPYAWAAANKDATDIDWSLVDYFVPQLYGAQGTLEAEWKTYVQYWLDGANKPNIHNVKFSSIPMSKFLWGMPADQCDQADDSWGASGCVEWAYSPNVHPSSPGFF